MWPFTQIARFFRAPTPAPPEEEPVFTHVSGDWLLPNERDMIVDREACPDCGTVARFIEEPPIIDFTGRFTCGNRVCGSRFNAVFPFGVERTSNAQPLAEPRNNWRS